MPTSGRRFRRALALTAVGVAVLFTSCSSTGSAVGPSPTTMEQIDEVMSTRVTDDHLDGAGLLVVADGVEIRRRSYGGYSTDTVIPIASASKWLTAATMMTLVDEGRISLDDPVSMYLPQFTGSTGAATIRQLLSHTSGIAQHECIWSQSSTLEACVDSIATRPAGYPVGSRFSYGNTSFSVAGRVVEVVTGMTFEEAFERRLADPLGMTHTRFDGNYYPTESNPVPAASAESTLDDYARFVEMISGLGIIDGIRILSESSVLEMETDSVAGIDTHADSAVRTTGIPTYGLGTWRDVVDSNDVGLITSGNGAYGFYPWVDRARGAYGIISVFDQRGSELAVPESQRTLHEIWGVLDLIDGPPAATGTTIYGR